jgi:hypothetical protein
VPHRVPREQQECIPELEHEHQARAVDPGTDLFGRFDEIAPVAKAVILTGAGRHFVLAMTSWNS